MNGKKVMMFVLMLLLFCYCSLNFEENETLQSKGISRDENFCPNEVFLLTGWLKTITRGWKVTCSEICSNIAKRIPPQITLQIHLP